MCIRTCAWNLRTRAGKLPHSGQFWLSIIFDIPVWDLNQGNIRQAQARVQAASAELESFADSGLTIRP